jgi:hypothetical protein
MEGIMIAELMAPVLARGATGLRRAMLAALFGLSVPALASAAEEAVLLASTAPGYAPGAVVNPADRLSLPQGASLTLLFRSGQMLRLRGPLDASVEQASAGGATSAGALAQAFRLRGVDASVIGGSRAIPPRQRTGAADLLLAPQRSGTWCIGSGDTVWLARPANASGRYALQRRGNQRGLAWPENAGRIEWPADLPIEDGDRFELLRDTAPLASFTFRRLPAATSEPAVVAEGILLGCRDQFAEALAQLARSVEASEAGR